MENILLTQSKTFIIGPVAQLLGWIMNGIFEVVHLLFGIENIGLCIIIFTIFVYMCMLPLTIKQQKYSRLSSKMQPEINKIQKKYKGKSDQASIMKMNEETKEVYAKYGTSPTGTCVQLLVQIPVIYALFRVINNIPAYVANVKNCYTELVEQMIKTSNYQNLLTDFKAGISNLAGVKFNFDTIDTTKNSIIDLLYKLQTSGWDALKEVFPDLSNTISSTQKNLEHMNNFLGLNIANSPSYLIRQGISTGKIALAAGAIAIPLLSIVTQIISMKLTQQASNMSQMEDNPMASSMQSSMKTMTYTMPVISAVMCLTLPCGLGIYWISGAVIRTIQMLFINHHLDKMNIDEIIEKNKKKAEKKGTKPGLMSRLAEAGAAASAEQEAPRTMSDRARINTKNLKKKDYTYDVEDKTSLASRANLVKEYNEKNND